MSALGPRSGKDRKALIRADGGRAMGTGHIMRCLAWAQAWVGAGLAVPRFACAELSPALAERLAVEGFELMRLDVAPGSPADAAQTRAAAVAQGAEWVVVDGYQFGAAFLDALRGPRLGILVLDDYGHAQSYPADLLLNQNHDASAALYEGRVGQTKLLLGTQYCLLRREFLASGEHRRDTPDTASRILITMGGADAGNCTERVLRLLGAIPGLELLVVVGGSNPHLESIQQAAAALPVPARVWFNTPEMPKAMEWAHLAVSAAGSTCWEAALLGLPLVLLVLSMDQRGIAESLGLSGVAVALGTPESGGLDRLTSALPALCADAPRRQAMSRAGRRLVDGRGAERVVAAMLAENL